jgi:UDP-glucose 4-epimerase
MERILITGGAGFIGSALADTLISRSKDCQVTVFDNLSTGSKENIMHLDSNPNFNFIYGNILDVSTLQSVVNVSDIVFHLAANPLVALGAYNTTKDFEENVLATYNLIEAMRKSTSCKKILYTSTSTVYGEVEVPKMPIPENYGPLKPISLYGATKLSCEAMISGYCYMFGISGVALRLANIIGPVSNKGVVFDFASKLSSNPNFLNILGNGRQNKSYLYIDDCIDAIMRIKSHIDQDRINFEIFNVGSDDSINVLGIANIVINEMSLKNVALNFENNNLEGRGWNGDVREFLLDCSLLKSLGWRPKMNSGDAIKHTARLYVQKILKKKQ